MSLPELIQALLLAEAWPHEPLEDPGHYKILIDGNSGRWPCVAVSNAALDQLVVYSVFPAPVPAPRRGPMMELLTRANFGLPIGCFELDLDDGELRFRTGLDFEDTAIDAKLVRNLFYLNIAVMDQHLPALEALISGEAPAEALVRVKRPAAP